MQYMLIFQAEKHFSWRINEYKEVDCRWRSWFRTKFSKNR